MAAIETLAILVLALTVIAFIAEPLLRRYWEPVEATELSKEAEDLYRRKESTYSALKELEFDFRTGKLSRTDFEELDAKYRAEAVQIIGAIDTYESNEAKRSEELEGIDEVDGSADFEEYDDFDGDEDFDGYEEIDEPDGLDEHDELESTHAVADVPAKSEGAAKPGQPIQPSRTPPAVRPGRPLSSVGPRGMGTRPAISAAASPDPDPKACACGFVSVRGAKFCAACGASLRKQADTVEADEKGQPQCPECGAKVDSEHHFCADCGTQLAASLGN